MNVLDKILNFVDKEGYRVNRETDDRWFCKKFDDKEKEDITIEIRRG